MIDLTTCQPKTAARVRLLLVEDDASVVESMRLLLETDYEVHSESTIASGVRRFRSLQPALVVLDLRLPDGEGLEVLRQIRQIDGRVPVVVLTGYASMRTVEESLRLGAADYLHKPFDGFALKSRIKQLLPGSSAPEISVKRSIEKQKIEQREITELKHKAEAAAMFLHDMAGPVTTALTAAHYVCDVIEGKQPVDENALAMGELLSNAMGYISCLFEQSDSIASLKKLPKSLIEMRKIVNLSLSLIQHRAEIHNVTIGVHQKNPESKICVNRFSLARVLMNLLQNAVEAVPPETGRVTLITDCKEGYAEFSVLDNGPGVPEELKERIFTQRFTTKKEGSGLGLYISKILSEAMGGELFLETKPGYGCCFTVKVPIAI